MQNINRFQKKKREIAKINPQIVVLLHDLCSLVANPQMRVQLTMFRSFLLLTDWWVVTIRLESESFINIYKWLLKFIEENIFLALDALTELRKSGKRALISVTYRT